MTAAAGKTPYEAQRELEETLKRIESKLDEVLDFNRLVAEVAAPFLSGKAPKWLALVAKSRGPRT